jgi:hypothetical protein
VTELPLTAPLANAAPSPDVIAAGPATGMSGSCTQAQTSEASTSGALLASYQIPTPNPIVNNQSGATLSSRVQTATCGFNRL